MVHFASFEHKLILLFQSFTMPPGGGFADTLSTPEMSKYLSTAATMREKTLVMEDSCTSSKDLL